MCGISGGVASRWGLREDPFGGLRASAECRRGECAAHEDVGFGQVHGLSPFGSKCIRSRQRLAADRTPTQGRGS